MIPGLDPPTNPALLHLFTDIQLMDSPRSATVLLIVGSVPETLRDAARHVHDEMAHPRCTVRWESSIGSPDPILLSEELRRVYRELINGLRASEADELTATTREKWRAVGPYGQGGSGMTGGSPYGRPMAERAGDRDGLELDQLPLRVGPFLPAFPAGLILDVQLQGDVIQKVSVSAEPVSRLASVFITALSEPVEIATIERARALSHLYWLAHALSVHGLGALGRRVIRLASGIAEATRTLGSAGAELEAISQRMTRSGIFRWSTAGVGRVSSSVAAAVLGPVARASGVRSDARIDEPAYSALGFEPIVNSLSPNEKGGDARARMKQRLAETAQSLMLVARAGGSRAWGNGVVEGPRGQVTASGVMQGTTHSELFALLPLILPGMEWGDAVTTLVSLDLGGGGDVRAVSPWTAAERLIQSAGASDATGASGMADMTNTK